jgi:hypothetical protein
MEALEGTRKAADGQRDRESKIEARHDTRLRKTMPMVPAALAEDEVVLSRKCSLVCFLHDPPVPRSIAEGCAS